MRNSNPLKTVVQEAVRKATGSKAGRTARGVRTASRGIGLTDTGNAADVSPTGYFTIGLSAIAGPDQIA